MHTHTYIYIYKAGNRGLPVPWFMHVFAYWLKETSGILYFLALKIKFWLLIKKN